MSQHYYHIKIATLLFLLFTGLEGYSQSLPIDFESAITTSDFIDFDGGIATVIENPQIDDSNPSTMVGQIVRDGGLIWSGSKIKLSDNLDFTTNNSISMKVFTTAPVGTTVKFKLEGIGSTERDVQTTVSGEWETMTWDFTGEPTNFDYIVFMFDFGNVGDGSDASTFLFDDIEQQFGGTQIDLPVDFESSTVNYTTTDFGGNRSMLVTDPTDTDNTVVEVVRTDESATYAGTTIGTNAGFTTDIPLTLTDSKMTVRVWSPEAGTPVRLKVEDSDDPTHTCETETNTTVSGDWEVIEFDFINQAPGTELLSIGLSMGWTYNMASIFFNFGTDGPTAGEELYYFDDVMFGDFVLSTTNFEIEGLEVSPNPSSDNWKIATTDTNIDLVEVYDLQGNLLTTEKPDSLSINLDASRFSRGMYVARISSSSRTSVVKLVKE